MALVGSAILGAFTHSPAEKAFRPLWDAVEDNIVYTIVALAIIVAPSSTVFVSTLACNLCTPYGCGDIMKEQGVDTVEQGVGTVEQEVGTVEQEYNIQFANRYCAYHGNLSHALIYFPHLLLLIGTFLVVVDRPFVLILFKSYNIEHMHRILVLDDPHAQNTDKRKESQEILSCLYHCSRYYLAYILRILASLVVCALPLAYLLILLINDSWEDVFGCYLGGFMYKCTGHPTQFYGYVAIFVIVLLSVYFLINVWNLVWILIPSLNSLHRVMYKFRAMTTGTEMLNSLYYNNSDVKLLLGLLASSSGIAVPLRSLALVDEALNMALLPVLKGIDEVLNADEKPTVNLRFSIPPLLVFISGMGRYKVTFILEHSQASGVFNNLGTEFVFSLPGDSRATGPVTVSTLIGGKTVVSQPISFNYKHMYPMLPNKDIQLDHVYDYVEHS